MAYAKGKSGNPKGRPKKVQWDESNFKAELKKAIIAETPKAFELLSKAVKKGEPWAIQLFFQLDKEQKKAEEVVYKEQSILTPSVYNPKLYKKLDSFSFSVRTSNFLKNNNIVYLGDLAIQSEEDLLESEGIGRKSLNEFKEILAHYRLKLGMKIPGWCPETIKEISGYLKVINII